MKPTKLKKLFLLQRKFGSNLGNQLIVNLSDELSKKIYGGSDPEGTNPSCNNPSCSGNFHPKNSNCTNSTCQTYGMQNTGCTNTSCNT